MAFNVKKASCYDLKTFVKKGTLLIANVNEFELTAGRIYVAVKNQGEGTFGDCIFVTNDNGVEKDYSSEYFSLYEGELVTE